MSKQEEKQPKITTPEVNIGGTAEEEAMKALLFGKFQDIKKMKINDMREEVQMWRNLWSWVPSEVKYYISRTGQTIGVQIRNYQRYIGPLLSTTWDLVELEIGVYDKVYDQVTGQYYFERKICKIPKGQIVDFDWISERISEEELKAKIEQEEIEKEQKEKQQQDITQETTKVPGE